MSEFLYPVYNPQTKENLYFKEFTNKKYKNLIKTVLNDDIRSFNVFVDKLLVDLCPNLDITTLTAYDKLYILFILRISNVGSTIEFSVERKKNDIIKFSIDLIPLIDKMDGFDFERTWTLSEDGFDIVVTIPKHFTDETDIYECVHNCIEKITFNNKTVDLSGYDYVEKQKILSKLPGTLMPKVISLLKVQDKIISSQPFIDIKIDQDVPFDKKLFLSFFNNSFYEMVKLAFQTTLKDFYVYEYTLIKKFKFSYDQINSITPAEIQVYFSVISEDLQREKEEREKQEQADQYHVPAPNNASHV